MHRLFIQAVALLGAALCFTSANAAPTGFNGFYDYSTWSSAETYGGAVYSSTDAAQQTLTMMEPDTAGYSTPYAPQEFTFSHTVATSGSVSFDWAFDAGVDPCCSGLNFYVNGNLFNLTGGYFGDPYKWGGANTSGSFMTSVNAGDVIAFGAFSADGCCRASSNTITNFDAPGGAQVPEPASLALLGLGFLAVAGTRRRKPV